MTKVLTAGHIWWSSTIGLHAKILSAFIGNRSRAADWLEAVNQAVCRQYRTGIREAKNLELNLMSGNGSQPTSLTFMSECRGRN
jgi:hypothetical protein